MRDSSASLLKYLQLQSVWLLLKLSIKHIFPEDWIDMSRQTLLMDDSARSSFSGWQDRLASPSHDIKINVTFLVMRLFSV